MSKTTLTLILAMALLFGMVLLPVLAIGTNMDCAQGHRWECPIADGLNTLLQPAGH